MNWVNKNKSLIVISGLRTFYLEIVARMIIVSGSFLSCIAKLLFSLTKGKIEHILKPG